MKFLAAILALVVLTLSVQPAFAKNEANEEIGCASHCCSDESEAPVEEEQQPSEPCSDFCNPFVKCGACAASTMEFLSFTFIKPAAAADRYVIASQSIYSQFDPDCWQPPKLT